MIPILIVGGRIRITPQYFRCIHSSISESTHGMFPTFWSLPHKSCSKDLILEDDLLYFITPYLQALEPLHLLAYGLLQNIAYPKASPK